MSTGELEDLKTYGMMLAQEGTKENPVKEVGQKPGILTGQHCKWVGINLTDVRFEKSIVAQGNRDAHESASQSVRTYGCGQPKDVEQFQASGSQSLWIMRI